MNTVEFNNWLLSNGTNKKVASDIVSRLKRIDRELLYSECSTSVDEQFNVDSCSSLLECLSKNNRDVSKYFAIIMISKNYLNLLYPVLLSILC